MEDSLSSESPESEELFNDSGTDGPEQKRKARKVLALLAQAFPPNTWKGLPAQVDRFRIIRRLGEGGFGVVYSGFDLQQKRELAIKVPHLHLAAQPDVQARFTHEARAAAKLKHANIVPVLEIGETDGVVAYIASKKIEGPTLAQWRKSHHGPVNVRLVAQMIADLASAVQFANDRGVFHRDIKPSNILLEISPDGSFVPLLTDFGLARIEGVSRRFTSNGVAVGTPEYMPPELFRGDSNPEPVPVDIYSLGATLYELLTGQPPFVAASVQALQYDILENDPVPPRRLCRDVPRELEVICLKCLEKNPQKRYASAGELKEDIGRCLDGQPIQARPPGVFSRCRRWSRTPRARRVAAVSVAVVLGLTIAAGAVAWRSKQQALSEARASSHSARLGDYAKNFAEARRAWESGNHDRFRAALDRCRPESETAEDLRGVEWYYLDRLRRTPPSERIIPAHEFGVCCLKYAPDGSSFATSGRDGLIKLWDARSAKEVAILEGHRGDVNRLAFSPDGQTLASVGDDGALNLWDLQTRQRRFGPLVHPERLLEVAFSPSGRILAVCGVGEDVSIWDASDAHKIGTLPKAGRLAALAFGPVGQRLIVAYRGGRVQYWDVPLQHTLSSLQPTLVGADMARGDDINQIVFAPNGETFATARSERSAMIWNSKDLRSLRTLDGHNSKVHCVTYSQDGRFVASGSRDRTVRVWGIDGTGTGLVFHHDGPVSDLAFSPDGKTLASASMDGTVRLWNWDSAQNALTPRVAHSIDVQCSKFALCPDGRVFLVIRPDESLSFLEWPGAKEVFRASEADNGNVTALVPSTDGLWLACSHRNGTVCVWDLRGRKRCQEFRAHTTGLADLAISPDGQTVATATMDGTICLWNWRGRDVRTTLRVRSEGSVRRIVFSPNGRTLATIAHDSAITLCDVETQNRVVLATGHTDYVQDLAFHPEGRMLASASEDETIKIWDVASRREVATLVAGSAVRRVAFSPDGKTIVSGQATGKVSFWQSATGIQLMSVDPPRHGAVRYLGFASDGGLLVAEIREVDFTTVATFSR